MPADITPRPVTTRTVTLCIDLHAELDLRKPLGDQCAVVLTAEHVSQTNLTGPYGNVRLSVLHRRPWGRTYAQTIIPLGAPSADWLIRRIVDWQDATSRNALLADLHEAITNGDLKFADIVYVYDDATGRHNPADATLPDLVFKWLAGYAACV